MALPKIGAALLAGLLFGAGLAVAGMTDPNKVLNFLNLNGRWDPSLFVVMGASVPVSAAAFLWSGRRRRPFFAELYPQPPSARADAWLLGGSGLFGLGWGLAGYCPGPALASLSRPSLGLIGFLLAMTLGIGLSAPVRRRLSAALARERFC